jgi:hypothetical protein
MTNNIHPSFEDIAIARDLVRKPEIKLLAMCLYRIAATEPVDKDNIPPMFVRMAHRMIHHPEHVKALNAVLEII